AVLLVVLAAGWGPAFLLPVLFIWAPLVMLSRVALGLHFLSDIVAGALLGLLLGGAAIAFIPPPL
ncbi:MAG: phosphatase PAP2 family protein, partial [Anaerolineales bacterium]